MKKILLGFIAIGLLTFVGCDKDEKEDEKGLTGEWVRMYFDEELPLSISEESITVVWYETALDMSGDSNKRTDTYDVLFITDNEIKIRISPYDSRVIRYSLDGDELFFIDNTNNTGIYDSRTIYTRK